jgi:hypothetical protein
MDWPYHFPHPADVIAREAERTRSLSVDERLERLAQMITAGEILARASGSWKINCRLRRQSEVEWQRAQQEVFASHGQ